MEQLTIKKMQESNMKGADNGGGIRKKSRNFVGGIGAAVVIGALSSASGIDLNRTSDEFQNHKITL